MKIVWKKSIIFTLTTACLVMGARNASAAYGDADIYNPATQVPDSVRPLFDTPIRDTQICTGPDGWYYMTGTSVAEHGDFFTWNDGIHVWKSQDLKNWAPLGLVFDLDQTTGWQRNFYVYPDRHTQGYVLTPEEFTPDLTISNKVERAAWANEIHYVPSLDTFVIVGCMNHNVNVDANVFTGHMQKGGTFILKSTSGKAEGPYENMQPNAPLTDQIDSNFFIDDDGSMYFVVQDNKIAQLTSDLTGLAEPLWELNDTDFPTEAYAEGVFLFKNEGKYHLTITYWSRTSGNYASGAKYSYDPLVASSDSLGGLYGARYNTVTGGGHGNFFKDHDGNWWACVFFNPRNQTPNNYKYINTPAIVAMKWVDGKIMVDKERTDTFYADDNIEPEGEPFVLAGWETWIDTGATTFNSTVQTGATGVAIGTADDGAVWTHWSNADKGYGASQDGTFGDLIPGALIDVATATSNSAVGIQLGYGGTMDFTVVNTNGSSINLTGFHFDGGITRTGGAADTWTLSIVTGSDVDLGNFGSGTFPAFLGPVTGDFDVDLTTAGMSDRMLAAGEQVIFRLTISGGTPDTGGRDTYIDNVAITASEPGGSAKLPSITQIYADGTNLIFSGINGTAGASYVVVDAPELDNPTVWTPVETNTFQAGGLFSVTNAIEPGVNQQFYRIEL